METKWHKGDKVWWVQDVYHFVIQMVIYQVVSVQVDGGPVKTRYRLTGLDERDRPELIDMNHLAVLDEEWDVGDDDLFSTELEALDDLFDRMRKESVECTKRAAWLLDEIERVKVRQDYDKLKGKQNGN